MRALLLLTFLPLISACGPAKKQDTGTLPQVSDFHLKDVNPASERTGQDVSPRDYAGVVTGWYFGHSS